MSKRPREEEPTDDHAKRADDDNRSQLQVCHTYPSLVSEVIFHENFEPVTVSDCGGRGKSTEVQNFVWKDVPTPAFDINFETQEASLLNMNEKYGDETEFAMGWDTAAGHPFQPHFNALPLQQQNLVQENVNQIVPYNEHAMTLLCNIATTSTDLGFVNVLLKPATATGCEKILKRYDLNCSGDFRILYNLCLGLLKCKVCDILLMAEKMYGDTRKLILIDQDDKVADQYPWCESTVKVYPTDGKMNVDYRYIELNCTLDRPGNRKITKLMKFGLETSLREVKREWSKSLKHT